MFRYSTEGYRNRLGLFSGPNVQTETGLITGNTENDNVRKLQENRHNMENIGDENLSC